MSSTTESPGPPAVAGDAPPGAAVAGRSPHSFSADRFSPMARPSYRIEITTVIFFSITLAVVDNAFMGVFVKQTFAGVAPPRLLNFMVGLVSSASEIANILSFIWVSASNGLRKVPFINGLQLAVILLVASLTFIPSSVTGLMMLTAIILLARVCWSGIILMRPTVWRANYRKDRAAIVGRFSSIQQFSVAIVGVSLAALLDHNPGIFRVAAPVASCLGLIALAATRRLRVRREPALLREEQAPGAHHRVGRPWQGPIIVWRVLRRDVRFAQFMICMFLLGFGNIMLPSILVVVLKDQFGWGYFSSILLTSTIPYFLMPLAVPVWARFLDRAHVVKFRSIHSWTFTAATMFFMLGIALHTPWLLVMGSVTLAVAYAGGTLAWNLGHVDFSPPAETSQYMATHITLNGVRALVAPITSIALYEQLLAWKLHISVAASLVLAVALVLSIIGSVGFVWLNRIMAGDGAYRARSR